MERKEDPKAETCEESSPTLLSSYKSIVVVIEEVAVSGSGTMTI